MQLQLSAIATNSNLAVLRQNQTNSDLRICRPVSSAWVVAGHCDLSASPLINGG